MCLSFGICFAIWPYRLQRFLVLTSINVWIEVHIFCLNENKNLKTLTYFLLAYQPILLIINLVLQFLTQVITNLLTSIAVSTQKSRHESFFVFHKNGYTVYEPSGCFIDRHVKENFGNLRHMPEELDRAPSMCTGPAACEWGQAVNVADRFVYVSQPKHGRVIVIDAQHSLNPVEVCNTSLWYRCPTLLIRSIILFVYLRNIWVSFYSRFME